MNEAVERYQAAFSRLEAADRDMKGLSVSLSTVTEAIRNNPASLSFQNGNPVPLNRYGAYNGRLVDLTRWPDGARLQSMFNEWNGAREALVAAWEHVPADRRNSLVAPGAAPGGNSRY
jgi:hypothetical protein